MASRQFSIVVALYNAAEYLDAFMRSIQRQNYPIANLDIIIVDDGSTDSSLAIAQRWERKFPQVIRTFSKSNGGPGSARNVGLKASRNDWITMCDPDDILDPNYFASVASFLSRDVNSRAQMLTTRLVEFSDGDIRMTHTHPLNWKFRQGERLIDLNANPEYVHLSGGTAFLRREVINEYSLEFDERIRPKFEDANFIGRYLAHVETPIIGIIPSAKYLYRKQRRNGSSLVQGAWGDTRSYYEVPMLGYYGLLRESQKRLGNVPRWAQTMVLYDLTWAYISDKSMHGGTGAMTVQQRQSIHASLDRVMSLIDEKTIQEFTAISMGWALTNMLLGHYKAALPTVPVVIRWKNDPLRQVTKMSYMYTGDLPEEEIVINGESSTPLSSKTVEHSLFGRVLVKERVFTLPLGDIVVYLDRARARITGKTGLPKRNREAPATPLWLVLQPSDKIMSSALPFTNNSPNWWRKIETVSDQLSIQSLMADLSRPAAARRMTMRVVSRTMSKRRHAQTRNHDEVLVKTARSAESSKYFGAWVIMDRIDRADDNGEHLYRYLRDERPDINAWFLLHPDSKDWGRLADDGFKLVAYGSDESVKLVLNAAYKISSHADRDVQYPIDTTRYGKDEAKIVFLQHGVTKDDLSRWINPKQLSLMITATRGEYDSIAGTENSYKWTSDEIKLTGFPRHDRLRHLADRSSSDERRNILIAPTWRQYLTDALKDQKPQAALEAFEESEYGSNWLSILRSPKLAELSARFGLSVRFLGHPNISSILPLLDLPEHIDVVTYDEISVQEELVSTTLIVSDFSSITFDAAYAGANVIYFHFDGDEIFRGGHVYRKGYFDYKTDGFGPVVSSPNALLREISVLCDSGLDRAKIYAERVEASFPHWDGKCSARVVAEIENLGRTWDTQMNI
ncbi:bifunctional glycosyltransferase/CDP-glycerol:glycerophosphate glycerophosphotransferase [Arthrobacter sp. Z1-15]